jgi:DNA (cytosine-5)-methyltransferase 1
VNPLRVDNFAGGGGASEGVRRATGRDIDIAINHDPEAIAMHKANHPTARHVCGDVFDINPRKLCGRRDVELAWFSPDCTFHSKARGGKPFRDRNNARCRRGLAGVAVRWAKEVRPRVIILENVEEFADWGPLLPDGQPCPLRRGLSFRRWLASLENAGYEVEMRELRACDFGAPTVRKRLFIIARSDGMPIVWPSPTHGPGTGQPYRTAADCIDWSIPCPSIFERKRPLADKTLARIARGLRRFVLEAAEPFIIPVTHGGDLRSHSVNDPLRTITGAHRGELALVGATLIQTGYGERPGQAPRVPHLDKPLGTIVAGGAKHALVTAFLAKHYGGHETSGSPIAKPVSTITTRDHHALVAATMVQLKGTSIGGRDVRTPMPTVCAQGTHLAEVRALLTRFEGAQLELRRPTTPGLVEINGELYEVSNIGMRMLVPRELYRGQGFTDDYLIDISLNGKPLSKEAQVRMCGNSVSPNVAAALVAANIGASQAVAA